MSTLQEPPTELKSSTIETYQTIYNRCKRRAVELREINPDEPVTITQMDLVDDWLANIGVNQPNTSNMQRSALLWGMQTYKGECWEEAHTRLSNLHQRNFPAADARDDGKNSRPPGRMIPESALQSLMNTLAGMDLWGARSQWFLLAGVASGARPIEWTNAEWVDVEKGVLRIYTAKVKSRNAWKKIPAMTFTAEDLDHDLDRGQDLKAARGSENLHSWYETDFHRRTAELSLTAEEHKELEAARFKNGVKLFRDVQIESQYVPYVKLHLDSVNSVIQAAQEQEEDAQDGAAVNLAVAENIFRNNYFNQVRHCIWRACKKTFPDGEMYSLADTRSTFSANRKAAQGLEVASGELGHASSTTSRAFYAPARKAWARYKKAQTPGDKGRDGEQNRSNQKNKAEAPGRAAGR